MKKQASINLVTKEFNTEKLAIDKAKKLLGDRFTHEVGPTIMQFGDKLSNDFKDCYWMLKSASNDSIYLSPSNQQLYHVICFDIYDGYLNADGYGLVSSIFAYSHLSHLGSTAFIHTYADMFYKLKQIARVHPESEALLQATNTLSV